MIRSLKLTLQSILVSLLSFLLGLFILGPLFIAFHYSDISLEKNTTAPDKDFIKKQQEVVITAANDETDYEQQMRCFLEKREKHESKYPGLPLPPELEMYNFPGECQKGKNEDIFSENNKKDTENEIYRIARVITAFLIKEYKETGWPILVIYILLISILSVSLRPFIYRRFLFQSGHKMLSNYEEFLINAPPMLGVLGTIFSLAYFMQQSKGDVGNISELLRGGFYDASLTTLIGGTVYLINLWIISKMKKDNE